jgi:formylglycine-generating enzyme required for sulfatase activity/predicted MPP superfamily phosphohydrolase/energy-coupling factor transporter ATP-binding protein EcfA2
MSEITILHLSDIHWRKKIDEKNKTFRQNVQNELIDAIATHAEKQGPPDFVAITGDIAFSGKKHEYDEAWVFFEKLQKLLPSGAVFLAVPGNHDVDRKKVTEILLLNKIVKEGKTNKLLESSKAVETFINTKFSAFRDFCQRLQPGLYNPGEKEPEEGEIRDDYFWVKNFEEKEVSFLGLNSSWASEGDQDRFNIALGYPQVYAALAKSTQPHRVILMHHPPFGWLEERDAQKWQGEVFNKCGLILHGHVHMDFAMSFSTPSDSCISIGANATYTHDGYIGFQFIEVKFVEDAVSHSDTNKQKFLRGGPGGGAVFSKSAPSGRRRQIKVRVCPYKLEEMDRIVFLPNTTRWVGQKGKPCFELETWQSCGVDDDLRPLQIPLEYREWIVQFHSKMDIKKLDPNARAYDVPLPEIYIPIETANPFYKPRDEKPMEDRGKKYMIEGRKKEDEAKEPQYIDIEELLGRKECILLRGPAGMGKTTLVKHLVYTTTHGQAVVSLCGYLPIVIFLKDLWPIYRNFLPGGPGRGIRRIFSKNAPPDSITFLSLLKIYLQTKVTALNPEVVVHFISRHRALFLLDGLDEVPEQFRQGLVEVIADFRLKNKNNRFLLTGRPHGIDADVIQHFGKFLRDIEPLDNEKVKTFVSDWFRVVSGQAEGLAEMTTSEMIRDIEANPYVSVFTQNPLLLTAVCILYLDNKRLPDQRAELYLRIVDNLICRRFQHLADPEEASRIDDFLKLLAFCMQEHNKKSINVGEAKQLLKEIFPQSEETPAQYNRRIDTLFEEIEPRCGLLNRPSEGEVEFLHLTFQEFLAARHVLYMDLNYKQFLAKRWWEETILLYTGLVNREWKDKANQMVKEILTESHKDPYVLRRLWLLGAKALGDIQVNKRDAEVVDLARKKLNTIIESDASLEERFDAGEILGLLGDFRIKSIPMVSVDAGEFTRGANKYKWEKPIRRIYLDEFMIGKYPVTNEEYKVFICESGYDNKDFWTPEGWEWKEEKKVSEPMFWHDRKWNGPNFPVVGVSWYEACAYAEWLSKKKGVFYTLPTEAQWEKAARGSHGSLYPWGEEFDKNMCNTSESRLNRTNPVGIFPKGKSPYGCFDMSGNVWEWCLDWYHDYYYKESPGKNPQGPKEKPLKKPSRILRGGSWFNEGENRRRCSGVFRDYDEPEDRLNCVGFRLVKRVENPEENRAVPIIDDQMYKSQDEKDGNVMSASIRPQENGLYTNSWALVIGINHYTHGSIPNLNFAENDAKTVASCLPALGFPEENIRLLLGEQSQITREIVLDILETEINPKMNEDDRFLFYFAGHGVTYEANKQMRGYILLQNSEIYGKMPDPAAPYLKKIPAKSLEMQGFLDTVQSLPGKHKLLLIDSCFSGFMTHAREISERAVIDINKKLGQWTMFPVTQVITAGRSGQKSIEKEFYQHGVFTWYLLKGLQGNADLRGDGVISFLDLANYIRDRVSQEKGVVQDPQVGTFGEGQFIFLYEKEEVKGAPPPQKVHESDIQGNSGTAPTKLEENTYKIALQAHNGQYVAAAGGGGGKLIAKSDQINEWEIFNVVELPEGKVNLQVHNGQYVRAKGGGGGELIANSSSPQEFETFEMTFLEDNKITFQAHNGHFVSVRDEGEYELTANRRKPRAWEIFILTKL